MPQALPLEPGDPESLGSYRLTGRLGEGGQGVVYHGEDPAGVPVAIKLLHARLAADPASRRRFVREAAAAERVARFCTAKVLHADVVGGRPYIVSEFVDGGSLQESVLAEGPRAHGALERLAIGTATALVAIHRAQVVHRDFKPQNVLMGPDGPRVIDFGIAKALDASSLTGQAVGTPAYMAPEQVRGEPPTPAADVFAWAATMVFASSGSAPFGQDALAAVLHRILHEEPRMPGLPLDGLLYACLAKDPTARPTAPQVLARLLGQDGAAVPDLMAQGTDQAALPAGAPGLTGGRPGGRRVAALAGAGTIALIGALVGGLVMNLALSDDEPTPAANGAGTPSPHDGGSSPKAPAGSGPPASDSGTPGTTSAPSGSGFPARFAGTWTGTVRQDDGRSWPIRLVIVEAAPVATVTYERPGCSGTQTLLDRSGDELRLREDITRGRANCTDSGSVTLRLRPGGALDFTYSAGRDIGIGSYTGVARLSRG